MTYENVVNILSSFFNEPHVCDVAKTISETEITGWEKWWQIELAHYLHKKTENQDLQWWREYLIINNQGDECKPDFWLWAGKPKHYYLIELKQADSGKTCGKGIEEDTVKLANFCDHFNCSNDGETYNCTGQFFIAMTKSKHLKISNPKVKQVKTDKVEGSEYSYYIFYRETNRI